MSGFCLRSKFFELLCQSSQQHEREACQAYPLAQAVKSVPCRFRSATAVVKKGVFRREMPLRFLREASLDYFPVAQHRA